ncbi:MAG: type I secretion C-terminal target domain-containing protein [Alphaproteobacteria bacterium]|nr:type I secretion C-terminal target domain-containing protein [Alphaproteobacteria bacterium]
MPNYTLQIEAYGVYSTDIPTLEIWADGVLDSSHSITASGSSISVTIAYGGSLPSSLSFTFNDGLSEAGRTIEIRSVTINDRHINTSNFLSTDSLVKSASATVDIVNSDFIFDTAEPDPSEFTPVTTALTAGSDTYRNYDGSDHVLDGLGGGDRIYLGAGNDKVNGNAGNDILRGGAGNDLLYGEAGNDKLFGEAGDDTLYGGDDADRIHGGTGDDEIHGGAGDDRLNGHDDDDIITGGAGDDMIHGGNGVDYLYGDAGDDMISAGSGDDTVDGGDDNDILYGGAGNDTVEGGSGDDIIVGDTGNDILRGDAGDDTIFGDNKMVVIGQAGTVTTNQANSTTWHTVTFDATITNPAVALTLNTDNDTDPLTLRVRNVTDTGFEWQMDEWDYLDGAHGSETISWLAIASGRHTMDDGTVIEAGIDSVSGLTDTTVNLSSAMGSSPMVMAQVTTTNEASALTTHIDNRTTSSFTVHVEEEKANQGPQVTATEDFAWIAIETGGSAAGGFLVGSTGDINSHTYDTISFGGTFMSSSPVVISSIQNEDGGDPSTSRNRNISSTQFDIKVHEEGSTDGFNHTNEEQGYYALTESILYGNTIDGDDTITGGDGLDTLYGGDGADTFLFEGLFAYNDVDVIKDFRYAQGDILDIKDLITGTFSGTITDYVQFVDSGSDMLVQVDGNGLSGGSSYTTIASLEGVNNLDEAALYTNGNIVIA